MSFNRRTLASHIVGASRKAYLAGIAYGVAFKMDGIDKAVDARKEIESAAVQAGDFDAKAVASINQAISNSWAFANTVHAKLTGDQKKAIKAC